MDLGFNQTGFTKANSIRIPDIFYKRLKTGQEDFDKLFGDGILPGSATTLTASAGCGKTSFLLQLLQALSAAGYNTGYASGEENIYQLAFTCKRLNVSNVSIANMTDIDTIAKAMESFDVMVVDSFQALTTKNKLNSRELEKYAISTLTKKAKETECALFFILHLTKDGKLKGSTLVPHTVDVNMQITMDPESEDETSRIISVYKNRFGALVDMQATIGYNGFQIQGKVDRTTNKAKSKKSRAADLKDQILSLDPPAITKQRIIKQFSLTSSQAYMVLRDLVDEGKLEKHGRGQSACWKLTKKQLHLS